MHTVVSQLHVILDDKITVVAKKKKDKHNDVVIYLFITVELYRYYFIL